MADIQLPDDDAASVGIICNITHLRSRDVPNTLSLESLLETAELADKYDVGEPIKPSTQIWIVQLQGSADDETRLKLLRAAYQLQHAECFASLGQQIVMQNTVIRRTEDRSTASLEALDVVFDALRKTRQDSLDKVCEPLEGILHRVVTVRKRAGQFCASDCSFAEKRLQYVASEFVSSEIWPASERNKKPLSSILAALRSVKLNPKELYNMPGVQHCVTCSLPYCYGAMDHHRTVLEIAADRIEQGMARLCYDCVREGEVMDPNCQHPSLTAE